MNFVSKKTWTTKINKMKSVFYFSIFLQNLKIPDWVFKKVKSLFLESEIPMSIKLPFLVTYSGRIPFFNKYLCCHKQFHQTVWTLCVSIINIIIVFIFIFSFVCFTVLFYCVNFVLQTMLSVHTYMPIDRHVDKQIERQTEWPIDKQIDREIDRGTYTNRYLYHHQINR